MPSSMQAALFHGTTSEIHAVAHSHSINGTADVIPAKCADQPTHPLAQFLTACANFSVLASPGPSIQVGLMEIGGKLVDYLVTFCARQLYG